MKKKKKQKKVIFRKLLFIGIISLILAVSPATASETHAFWGEFVQEAFHFTLLKIYDQIQGMIMGALKQQAVTSLNNQMNSIIGGSSGGSAMFITNWENYLVGQPTNITRNYMNDYLSQMTRGRGSASGYAPEGFSGNYTAQLNQIGQNVINPTEPKPTYEGDPSQMFESGNFKNMSNYLSGVNNPWAFNTWIDYKNQQELENNRRIAETKAQAYQGAIGTGEQNGRGMITNPGSLTIQNMANVQDLGNKIIAGAQSIPEVIASVVSQMITRSIQQGFSSVQRNIQREVNNTQSQMNSQINNAINQSGPGARF